MAHEALSWFLDGDCTGLVLEYLLCSREAFVYALLFPKHRVFRRISGKASAQAATRFAVSTGNKKHVEALLAHHRDEIDWNRIFLAAVSRGTLKIMSDIRFVCPKTDLGSAMETAASSGHLRVMDQLHAWGANPELGLVAAAGVGCIPAMKRAVKLQAFNFHEAFVEAAMNGHIRSMQLIWQWKFKVGWGCPTPEIDILREAVREAAASGFVNGVKYVMQIVPQPHHPSHFYAVAICAAAAYGQLPVLLFFGKIGVTVEFFREAFPEAASHGRNSILKHLWTRFEGVWDAEDINHGFKLAGAGGFLSTVELLHEWGATDYEMLMCEAAENDFPYIMERARSWGATNFDEALGWASVGGALNAMVVLREWGATQFSEARQQLVEDMQAEEVIPQRSLEALALLDKWIGGNAPVA
jgi:hypothetical protein